MIIWKKILNLGITENSERTLRMQMLNRVAFMSLLFSVLYFFIFYYLNLFIDAITMLGFMFVFGYIMYMNSKGDFNWSRVGYMVASNLGLLYFSLSLGFDSGIHLFTCLAPVFVFSVFTLKDYLGITLSLLSYIINYFIMFYFSDKNMLYTVAILFTTFLQTVIVFYLKQKSDKLIEELKKQNEELDRKYENAKKFAYILSHEVRSPLATILGLVEIYKLGIKDDVINYLETASEQLDLMIKKLNNLISKDINNTL